MSEALFDLSGRVALVTGSSQGLGEATARVLAQRGAHVCQAWRMVCKHHPSGCGVLMEDLGVEVPYGP